MKKIILAVLGLTMFVGLLTYSQPVLADACPTGSISVSPGEAVCNPAPDFFSDLGQTDHSKITFPTLIIFVIKILIGVVGLLTIFFIMLGGFQFITSRGNEEQAETGKKTLTNAIIGLVIVILSYVIVAVLINALNGNVK